MTRDELLDILYSLIPGHFEDVLFRLRVPMQYLSQGSQATRAIEVIRYLESQNCLSTLEALLQSSTKNAPLTPSTVPRLYVMRLTLDKDPRSAGGLLLLDATIVEPIIPQLAQRLPKFPIAVANLNLIYSQVLYVLKYIGAALNQATKHVPNATEIYHWREFVLEIEIPSDLAKLDFEFASDQEEEDLALLFRCVTLRPQIGPNALVPIRGLDRPIVHPRYQKNAVSAWATDNPKILFRTAQGRDCLFTGPAAWDSCNGIPPIVGAFRGFPGAIVCQADDENKGLGPLYEDKDQLSWPELLDRVTELRRNGTKLKVLWNDPSYAPFIAESV
jgi:hypothetical protein